MKKSFLILAMFLGLGTIQLSAQDFIQFLKSKDYTQLSEHFSSTVKVEFDRKKKNVSKTQALTLIQDKLESFQPVRWETLHKGSSEDKNAGYLIAKAFNAAGEGLRIFIHLEDGSDAKRISGLRVRNLL